MSSQSYVVAAMGRKSVSGRTPPWRRDRRAGQPRRYMPLVQRVTGLNVELVLAAVAVTVVLLASGKLSTFVVDAEVAVVVGAIALVRLVNVYLVRRVVGRCRP